MALSTRTKVYAITDAKAYPLLSDPEGGTPTYGDPVDVPGVKSFAITGDVATETLEGDNGPLDSETSITGVGISLAYAKLSLEFLSLLLGGAVASSGTTPNERLLWELTNGSRPMPFKLEGVSASADPVMGNVDYTVHNVKLSSFPELGLAEKTYKTFSIDGRANPLLSTGRWVSVGINETARVLGVPA